MALKAQRIPTPSPARPVSPPLAERAFASAAGGPQPVQAAAAAGYDFGRVPVHPEVVRPSSAGASLAAPVRARMEAAFGHDFSKVRVHQGAAAGSIGAKAFTRGTHIHFAGGRYQPHSREGQRLLGHELAHVVQQRAGRVAAPAGAAVPINASHSLEAEAEAAGDRAAAGRTVEVSGAGGGVQLAAAAPIQMNGKDQKKAPSLFTRIINQLIPPRQVFTTSKGRQGTVGPTVPTWYGVNPHIGIKASISDEMGSGSGSTTLDSTGERFRGASVKATSGKGTSDAVHEGWQSYAKQELGTVPEHFSTSFTPTSLKPGNAVYAQKVTAALKQSVQDHTPEQLANALARGHGGAMPVAGAQAKEKIGYLPETATNYGETTTFAARHPGSQVNPDLLKKFNYARRVRGGVAGAVLGGMLTLGAGYYMGGGGGKPSK